MLKLKHEIISYPDGAKYVRLIEPLGSNKDYILIHNINNYEDLWLLSQFNDILEHNKTKCYLRIPNLIDAQADRRFHSFEPSSLKLVCNFLNSLKSFHTIEIFHPHNQEVVEALIDNVRIVDNSRFIRTVLDKLEINKYGDFYTEKFENNLILMSSDAGGFKTLMKLCDKINWKEETYSASKARDPKTHKLTQLIDRKDFGGKDILIIDDICVYGGTFKGLSKLLRERNCGKLYLAISHMTVQNIGKDSVLDYFDKVFTTNSKYISYWAEDNLVCRNLEIIKMF